MQLHGYGQIGDLRHVPKKREARCMACSLSMQRRRSCEDVTLSQQHYSFAGFGLMTMQCLQTGLARRRGCVRSRCLAAMWLPMKNVAWSHACRLRRGSRSRLKSSSTSTQKLQRSSALRMLCSSKWPDLQVEICICRLAELSQSNA